MWSKLLRNPFRRKPRLALLTCVRNEAPWLPAFLRYHHAIGVERAYIFLDRCSDDSEAIARSFPWARTFRVDPDDAVRFTFICDLHGVCMNHGLTLARSEGFDWLMTIDPDEFACADNPDARTARERANLIPLLQRAQPETVQIRLATRELVPIHAAPELPFWRQRFFQTKPALTWTIFNPRTGQESPWREFLGHEQGKSIVRTGADIQSYDSHRWVPNQDARWPERPEFSELPTETLGHHLHYFISSQQHWLEKFPKHAFEPGLWFCGKPVELPKQCWKETTSQLSAAELENYYDRWIGQPEAEVRGLIAGGMVVEDAGLAQVLHEAGGLDGNRLPRGKLAKCDRAAAPEFFRPLGDANRSTPGAHLHTYPAAKLRPTERKGFHPLERSGTMFFRWTEPRAALQVHVPPGDYRLHLDMKHLSGHWSGKFELRINDRPVPTRKRQLASGVLTQILTCDDFPSADAVWLQFEFNAIDTSKWPGQEDRRLGAPLFNITFEPGAA